MEPWCHNWLLVRGEPGELRDLREQLSSRGNQLDFERLLPTPVQALESQRWKAWRNQHWGTPWNSSSSECGWCAGQGAQLLYRFDTYHQPPRGVLRALQASYPQLQFRLQYSRHPYRRPGPAYSPAPAPWEPA